MNRPLLIVILALLPVPTLAQHDHTHTHGSPTPKQDKTSPGVASLDVYASRDGTLHLLLARRHPNQPATLEYLRSTDAGQTWSAPLPVGTGQPAPSPIHRGQDAQIAASGDTVVAAWTTAGKLDKMGRGPVATAVSHDAGRTWHPGPNPSDVPAAIGHAFLDLAADPAGAFHLVWLDGRESAPAAPNTDRAPATTSPAKSTKGLRYARSIDGGKTWSPNTTLDPATCECCWNVLTVGPDNRLSVLYRDRDPRDMAAVHSADNGLTWSPAPTPVGPFGWNINACPHVGGALAFAPDAPSAHAIVWSAKDAATRGAYLLSSPDAGRTWSAPRQLGDDPKSWHADLATGKNGLVVATWDAYTEDGGALFTTTSPDHGRTWSAPARLTPKDISATHPRLLRVTDTTFRVFWTQSPAEGGASTWNSAPITPAP